MPHCEKDLSTVDMGGPTASPATTPTGFTPNEWTYIEATFPTPIAVDPRHYTGLELIEMPFPGSTSRSSRQRPRGSPDLVGEYNSDYIRSARKLLFLIPEGCILILELVATCPSPSEKASL